MSIKKKKAYELLLLEVFFGLIEVMYLKFDLGFQSFASTPPN
jgi:hypothetical protein